MGKIILLLLLVLAFPAHALDMADPRPDWDHPRKLVLQLNSADPSKINAVFSNAINTQKFYGNDNVRIAIIAYGPGLRAVLKGLSPVARRVAALHYAQIEFVACQVTLDSLHKTAADLLPGVVVTPAGVPELMERQLSGWVYVAP
jgi:uncharacterized protein